MYTAEGLTAIRATGRTDAVVTLLTSLSQAVRHNQGGVKRSKKMTNIGSGGYISLC